MIVTLSDARRIVPRSPSLHGVDVVNISNPGAVFGWLAIAGGAWLIWRTIRRGGGF